MGAPSIRAEGLRKRFDDVVALDGIDLEVAPATVFGLLGPNGAGKTTAVRILTTILTPDEGRASVLGLDVATEPQAVRQVIGLAGQSAAVDGNLTGAENLRLIGKLTHLPKDQIRPRAAELLRRFDLTDAGDRPARTYSGGMRRRLDVAAALVHRPPVLFLDEPTTGLDPQSRNDLWEMIRELVADGTTVLLTTQYLEEADRLAHRVAVVDGGRVIAEGTSTELKARLGTTVVEIGFAHEEAASQAESIVAALDGFAPAEREGPMLRLKCDDGGRVTMDVLRALDGKDLVPASLALREPSLDDVFLSLTGRHAEPAGAPEEPRARGRGAGGASGPAERGARPARQSGGHTAR